QALYYYDISINESGNGLLFYNHNMKRIKDFVFTDEEFNFDNDKYPSLSVNTIAINDNGDGFVFWTNPTYISTGFDNTKVNNYVVGKKIENYNPVGEEIIISDDKTTYELYLEIDN